MLKTLRSHSSINDVVFPPKITTLFILDRAGVRKGKASFPKVLHHYRAKVQVSDHVYFIYIYITVYYFYFIHYVLEWRTESPSDMECELSLHALKEWKENIS